ncbi:zinc-finger homeodomain protein 6-like [Musa acuminata AAA Group]|uniref:zinc-finger homeodomain protein 6-like n=1 Tax=Musa acuminata AAA Group TaxID=214697 RepID=UPI0031DB3ACF
MEFRNPGEIGIPASSSSSSGYKPSLVRGGSAFSKPTLFPSTSFVSPRGEGDAGGAGVGSGGVGRGGARNGNILGNTEALPPPTLESTPTAIDRLPQSLGKNADQAAISNSSPGAAGVGLSADNSKPTTIAKTSTITAATSAAYISTKYKECLRNHAAALGGHVVDGCGEFMPSGDPDTPEALKCAACGCHRSFHRRETDGSAGTANSYYHGTTRLPLLLPPPHPQAHPHHQQQFQLGGFSSSPSAAVRGLSGFVHFGGSNPSGSGGTTTESSSEERLNTATPTPTTIPRKRFRTKFTAEQKENMLAFAERVGWRFQRQDDAMVEQFCAEIGVRRQVLKVWMHNNKHTVVRKQQQLQPPPPEEQPVQQPQSAQRLQQ